MKFLYQIIITRDNKQVEFVGMFKKEAKAYAKFLQMKKQNDNVIFPMRYINKGRSIKEVQYEIVLIKKKEEHDSNITLLRNNYGEFVPHETNNNNWIVCDKAIYLKEETFWVYGFHPLVERKDIHFIFSELIKPNVNKRNDLLNIMIYKNKLLLNKTNNLDLIICKNKEDCIRLYNTIKDLCQEKKYKYIVWSGNQNTTQNRQYVINLIQNLTNWNKLKISRSTTRP